MDRFTISSPTQLGNRVHNVIHTLPLLRTLHVQEWQFTEDVYWSRFSALRNAALDRASDERTSRLEKIIINDCSISREQIEELRAILKVEWDGIKRSGTQNQDGGSFDVDNDDTNGDGELEPLHAVDWGTLDEDEED
ncbi:hypothetical protein HGRIS_011784 [Hohenbuehelia grisea]|uniref:Uncharacterized protein n=1 Tax=Hohenbuehelia grisea TaxID=104357 RepID=A0ABR3JWZ1_9AGAR